MTLRRYIAIVLGSVVVITAYTIATGSDPTSLRQQRLSECSAMMKNRLRASGDRERAAYWAGELCRIREYGLEGVTN